jgi:transcriptional regulator with XRE-family HTH domain
MPEPPEPPPAPPAPLVPASPEGRSPFAQWLRRWRRSRDLTQEQAGEVVGYSRNLWAQLETGSKLPSAAFLAALARHSGLSARVLADWANGVGPDPDGEPPSRRRPDPPPGAPPYPPYPGYPGYPPYPPPYPPYPAYPEYPRYPDYPTQRPRAGRRRPRPPRRRVNTPLT